MTDLFSPLTLRGVTMSNRIGMAPMCMYTCDNDGMATDWHYQHLVSRSFGLGLVIVEASAVVPEGRITPHDLGIWSDAQIAGHRRLADGIARMGAVPAIQIAHAGRKASRNRPWLPGAAPNGWQAVAPSAVAFDDFAVPHAMSTDEIKSVIAAFAAAAKRSVAAGYRLVELHGAHGYLMHQFLSPLSNQRQDEWGGSFENRIRFALEITAATRAALPSDVPLAIRLSHTDWVEGGWTTEETVELSRKLRALGVDLVDVSSGGLHPAQKIALVPGYQVPGAEAVKKGAEVVTAAVGLITEAQQAQDIITQGKADMALLARAFLRDPYWAVKAAGELGRMDALHTPPQYDRAWNALGKTKMDASIAASWPNL